VRIFSCVLGLPYFYSMSVWIFSKRVLSCLWYLGLGAGLVLKEIRRFLSTALLLFALTAISVPVRSHWGVDPLEPALIPSMFLLLT